MRLLICLRWLFILQLYLHSVSMNKYYLSCANLNVYFFENTISKNISTCFMVCLRKANPHDSVNTLPLCSQLGTLELNQFIGLWAVTFHLEVTFQLCFVSIWEVKTAEKLKGLINVCIIGLCSLKWFFKNLPLSFWFSAMNKWLLVPHKMMPWDKVISNLDLPGQFSDFEAICKQCYYSILGVIEKKFNSSG